MAVQAPAATMDDSNPMLTACSSGDAAELQRLLSENGIEKNSKPIITQCVYGKWKPAESPAVPGTLIPSTLELLDTAVAAGQLDVVDLLLKTYPSLSFSEGQNTARVLINHPDAAILKRICEHDPGFAGLTMDYGYRTFFTQACDQPPQKITPLLMILLDYGADVDDGGGAGGGALLAAIAGNQSAEVIGKAIECHKTQKVPISRRHVNAAISRSDEEIVSLLLSSGLVRDDDEESENYAQQAENTGNKAIIALVEDWRHGKGKAHTGSWLAKQWAKVQHVKS